MKRLFAIVLFCVLGSAGKSFALPPCPTDQNKRFHNCYGTYTWADGAKYVGEWKDGLTHGQGTFFFAGGDKYIGEFKDALSHGQGIYTYVSGAKYIGEFKDDNRWTGIFYNADGTVKGTYSNGVWISK